MARGWVVWWVNPPASPLHRSSFHPTLPQRNTDRERNKQDGRGGEGVCLGLVLPKSGLGLGLVLLLVCLLLCGLVLVLVLILSWSWLGLDFLLSVSVCVSLSLHPSLTPSFPQRKQETEKRERERYIEKNQDHTREDDVSQKLRS